ncbi:hypothetical protein LTS18_005050 [Coniosporium uncinatum]|uniref:Uncharacterized protein n=1 Tax=Coniosporium uncinatum TaxID=93489 RepID=A0ACC3DBN9_9PEZI|nr:hypothetical protein LTS18_005050 [Coniosporium uncinatum]
MYLKQNPNKLPHDLWSLFRKWNLCRTPEEERLRRFETAVVVKAETTTFATSMIHALKAYLRMHDLTKEMDFAFVDGQDLHIDALFSREEKMWKVDQRWTTVEGTHQDTYCDQYKQETMAEVFCCDHAVIALFGILVDSIGGAQSNQDSGYHERQVKLIKSTVVGKLAHMPRAISISQTDQAGQLRVQWESVERLVVSKRSQSKMRVLLYSEKQRNKFDEKLLHGVDDESIIYLASCRLALLQLTSIASKYRSPGTMRI